MAAVGFDAAAWEIWPTLSIGATLVLAPREVAGDTGALLEWWASQSLDVSFLPTPVAELAFSQNIRNETLRVLLVGGDRLRHHAASESLPLINNYGPTEATVVATSGRMSEEDPVLHIGRPIANTQVYILDRAGQPVPVGVAGELYIAGAGVARGYLNRTELTAERFIQDPFSGDPQGRMYKSGDLGRWRADGAIEYLGRNDHQVKIRGFRIELGEIEAQLVRHEGIKEAVVIAREDIPGDWSRGSGDVPSGEKRLVAYVVGAGTEQSATEPSETGPSEALRGEAVLSAEALRAYLKPILPEYMVPSAFVLLETLAADNEREAGSACLACTGAGCVRKREVRGSAGGDRGDPGGDLAGTAACGACWPQ